MNKNNDKLLLLTEKEIKKIIFFLNKSKNPVSNNKIYKKKFGDINLN